MIHSKPFPVGTLEPPDNDTLERVARAICTTIGWDASAWPDWLAEARAAIAAYTSTGDI